MPPSSLPRHWLIGLPKPPSFTPPHCQNSWITAFPTTRRQACSRSSPTTLRICPNHGLHEEKMSLTGLCNRLVIMSTRMVAPLSNVRLTSFRPVLRFPALLNYTLVQPANRSPPHRRRASLLPCCHRNRENPTPSLGKVGALPLAATLTLPTRPSQAQPLGLPSAPRRPYQSIHETAEHRRWYPLSHRSSAWLRFAPVRRQSLHFTDRFPAPEPFPYVTHQTSRLPRPKAPSADKSRHAPIPAGARTAAF
jgi:hypothetical protein